MSFVLGLDAGGSKTVAAIADISGAVVGRWEGPSLDPQRVIGWQSVLAEGLAELCRGEMPQAAVLGLPMHGEIPALSELQRQTANKLLTCPHHVLNDVEIACDGAFLGENGVLLLAGTGSMAWAKTDGKNLRVGGWGDAFGDEGSAFWIGREALSLASRMLDGRSKVSGFAEAVLAACDCSEDQLVIWTYGQQNFRAAVAAIALHVDRMADGGEEAAITLLREAATRLAAHVQAVRQRLARPSLPWSYAGSVFRSHTVSDHLVASLGAPSAPKLPPVGGAIWGAAELAGWQSGNSFASTLSHALNHNK